MTPNGTPYIDNSGAVIIPSTSDQKYHYWNGGQPISDTLIELNVSEEVWNNHTTKPFPGKMA